MIEQRTKNLAQPVRIELVDNWHKDWDHVSALIDRIGQRAALMVDADGWLSARQNLMVAFIGDEPAGHLCFRVEPATQSGRPMLHNGRAVMQARLDALGVDVGLNLDADGLTQLLRTSATVRARELNCRELVGFEAR